MWNIFGTNLDDYDHRTIHSFTESYHVLLIFCYLIKFIINPRFQRRRSDISNKYTWSVKAVIYYINQSINYVFHSIS